MSASSPQLVPTQSPAVIPAVDLLEAVHFLHTLDAEAEIFLFRAICAGATRELRGSLEDCAGQLAAWNAEGFGVYVVVNEASSFKDQDVTRIRAVFADFDGTPLPESFELEPHTIVNTSPGKYHVYWLVDGLSVEQFKPIQQAIARNYGSDSAVCNLSRLMRVPGFLHHKGEPFQSRIIHESGGVPYEAECILAAFPPESQPATAMAPAVNSAIIDGERNATLTSLGGSMRRRGFDPESIEVALQIENARKCMPPLAHSEVAGIARSVAKYTPAAQQTPTQGVIPSPPIQVLREVRLGDLHSAEIHAPEFVVEKLVPRRVITLLGGHGGIGKSTFAETIGAHLATDTPWCGLAMKAGPVAFLTLEDEPDVIRYRMRRIADEYGLDQKKLDENFRIIDGTEWDDGLATLNKTGELEFTQVAREIEERATGVQLLIIDNASEAYLAEENNRRQVRGFIRELAKKIARKNNSAVILLAHIDKDAAKNGARGNSYSGTTQWHNSVRSRVALVESDGEIELRHEKSNFGPKIPPITLRCNTHGILVPVDPDTSDRDLTGANRDLLRCLVVAFERGEFVSTSRSGSANTHAHMKKLPGFPNGLLSAKKQFWKDINRLEESKLIIREKYVNKYRKEMERWIPAPIALNAPNAYSVQ